MNDRKIFPVRLSDYEKGQLAYFAETCGMTAADLLRLSLRLIQTDTRPSECEQLKKIYERRE